MGFAAISRLRLPDARDTQGQVSTCALHDVWGNGIWETEGQTGEKPAHKAPLTQQLLWMNVKAAPSLRYGVGLLVFVLRSFFFSPHQPLIGE